MFPVLKAFLKMGCLLGWQTSLQSSPAVLFLPQSELNRTGRHLGRQQVDLELIPFGQQLWWIRLYTVR